MINFSLAMLVSFRPPSVCSASLTSRGVSPFVPAQAGTQGQRPRDLSPLAPGFPLPRERTRVWLDPCATSSRSAAVALGRSVVVLGDAPCADHLHVLVHHASGASGIAHLDQRSELLMDAENAPRHRGRKRRIAQRP